MDGCRQGISLRICLFKGKIIVSKAVKSWTAEVENRLLPYVDKPAQYLGGEFNSIEKDWDSVSATMALLFPDLYEIGMSHLGMRILYDVVNRRPEYLLERSFAPAVDMEQLMRENGIPLFTWENYHSVRDFDIVGVTLQYEMSFTNILNMLELAGIPLMAAERRDWEYPLVIAGGPCAYNPEPLVDFFDLFVIGEGEEVELELLDLYTACRAEGVSRDEFLHRACCIPGIYVPRFYQPVYNDDGRMVALQVADGAPQTVQKRIIRDMDSVPFPQDQIVPFAQIVHDRAVIEVMRGCNRGCRFCQAGIIYRPVREKSPAVLREQAARALDGTGYDELGMISLSTADYSCVSSLIDDLLAEHGPKGVNVSLPSLRVDAISVGLAEKIQQVRKSGFTLAPEAGTQRLRDIINKGVTEDDIDAAIRAAVEAGWSSFKLYFMAGLPFETDEDLLGIAETARHILALGRSAAPVHGRRRPLNITVSVSFFVPKTHTPFQWFGQNSREELARKRDLLYNEFRSIKNARLNCHDVPVSFLEGVFSRGDRRLGAALLEAHRLGCRFDSWHEHFDYEKWMQAFENCGIDAEAYAGRVYRQDEVLPWEHIDAGVSRRWLWREWQKAAAAETTQDCRKGRCSGCGVCPALECDNQYCAPQGGREVAADDDRAFCL